MMESKKNLFADRLKHAMILRGMKAARLCELTGVSDGAMSQYTNGKFKPKSDTLRALARALNVSSEWLEGYDVPVDPPPSPKLGLKFDADPNFQRAANDYKIFTTATAAILSAYGDKPGNIGYTAVQLLTYYIGTLNADGRVKLLEYAKDIAENDNYVSEEYLKSREEENEENRLDAEKHRQTNPQSEAAANA